MTLVAGNEIDLALAVLSAVALSGQTLTQSEIADVCGCDRQTIFRIEKRALKNLRSSILKDYQGAFE